MAGIDVLACIWCIYQLWRWCKDGNAVQGIGHSTSFNLSVDVVMVLMIGAAFSVGVLYLLSPVCVGVHELQLNCTDCVGFCTDISDFCRTVQEGHVRSIPPFDNAPPVYGLELGVAFTFVTFLLVVGSMNLSLYDHMKSTHQPSFAKANTHPR